MAGTWSKPRHHRKKNSMKYFCIIKEKIVYMECLIQSSMFYSFYLFLSFLLCNVDSVLVSPQIQILIFQSFLCCWYLVKKNKYKRGKRFLYVSSYPFKILKVRFLLGRGGGCLRWAWRNYWITTNGGLSDKGWSSVPPPPSPPLALSLLDMRPH